MRFRLRTLLILLAMGPPMLAMLYRFAIGVPPIAHLYIALLLASVYACVDFWRGFDRSL